MNGTDISEFGFDGIFEWLGGMEDAGTDRNLTMDLYNNRSIANISTE